MADEMMLIPKADLVAGYDAVRAKGVPGLIKSGELAGKIASIQGGAPNGESWENCVLAGIPEWGVPDKPMVDAAFTYNGDLWIAADRFHIYKSKDARRWVADTSSDVPGSGTPIGAIFSAGNIIIASTGEGIYVSTDLGGKWSLALPGSTSQDSVFCQYGGKIMLSGFTSKNGIAVSNDGLSWRKTSLDSGGFFLSYSLGKWVAGSVIEQTGLWYSSDGENFSHSNITSGLVNCVTFIGGEFYASVFDGEDKVYKSEDGSTWEALTYLGGLSISSIWRKNGVWGASSQVRGLIWSENGVDWLDSNIKTVPVPNFVEVGGSVIIAYGAGRQTYTTNDGKTWKQTGISKTTIIGRADDCWVATSGDKLMYSPVWEPS